ncbi:MAG TPA: 4Fe-4S dicluster domain-containing protein [Thermoplasmata archaeon]|nr:4Fe-4S dicluster domain-containing protein [Thermoplasmata archaeon]
MAAAQEPGTGFVEIKRRLATLRYTTDAKERAHITVRPEVCARCPHSRCTFACPAKCYERIDGRLVFRYEDCLECGACDIACDQGSVTWALPRGPYGVRYTYG